MTGALSSDAVLVPASFVADTSTSIVTPLTSPETVMGEVALSVLKKLVTPLPHKAV